jgi:hypothetical protein
MVNNADGAGVMGHGAIDGRGGTSMLIGGTPSSQSWWDMGTQENCPRMMQVNNPNGFTLYKTTLMNKACNFHVAMDDVSNFTAYGVKSLPLATHRTR